MAPVRALGYLAPGVTNFPRENDGELDATGSD